MVSMAITRNGKPASKNCKFGHPHLWAERVDHEDVYDCHKCGATDTDDLPAGSPEPAGYADWLASRGVIV